MFQNLLRFCHVKNRMKPEINYYINYINLIIKNGKTFWCDNGLRPQFLKNEL